MEKERIETSEVFTVDNISRAIKRIRSVRDGDSLVEPILRRALLTEYGEELAAAIAHEVRAGTWKPEPAYVCTIPKGECGFRELSFPGLLDSIVGRSIIDALEGEITKDDNGTAFCGRSHASTKREPGDYEKWFEVWQDYSAAIATACENVGYTYVYNTDITDFFPSVQRHAAKKELARRTSASPELLELLFYLIESWLPRVQYAPMSGLPIDDIDISRLVAHNFLKQVDHVVDSRDSSYVYLRFVDDAVFIVPELDTARSVARKHHCALRAVGLNPSTAKSEILTIRVFQDKRQRDTNLELDEIEETKDNEALKELANEWHSMDKDSVGNATWERLCWKLFSIASKLGCWELDQYVVEDIQSANDARLVRIVFRYLRNHRFGLSLDDLRVLISSCSGLRYTSDRAIYGAHFLAEGVFKQEWSKEIANTAYGNIIDEGMYSPGIGYARAHFLLALHKHGDSSFRERLRTWIDEDPVHRASDQHMRTIYLYVMACRNELLSNHRRALTADAPRDTHLALRLADGAYHGELKHNNRILKAMSLKTRSGWTISSRSIPLLWALSARSDPDKSYDRLDTMIKNWLSGKKAIIDEVCCNHLRICRNNYKA